MVNKMNLKHNILDPAEPANMEAKECWIPNKMFMATYLSGIVGIIALSLSGALDIHASKGLLTLGIIYGLLGSLVFFSKFSIVRCPSRILLGAAAFISITAFVDKYYI